MEKLLLFEYHPNDQNVNGEWYWRDVYNKQKVSEISEKLNLQLFVIKLKAKRTIALSKNHGFEKLPLAPNVGGSKNTSANIQ